MKTSIWLFLVVFATSLHASAQVTTPMSLDSWQLQQLIANSERQIESLREILSYKRQDLASLQKASAALAKLSSGIDQSIASYQGTEVYGQALVEIQAKDDYRKTFSDSQQVRDLQQRHLKGLSAQSPQDSSFADLVKFQRESVRANQSDLSHQGRLEEALAKADPGFVPKIEAQAQLGNWQANTRISAQMTELLAAIHAVREELRILRLQDARPNALNTLVVGSEIQNQKQRESRSR